MSSPIQSVIDDTATLGKASASIGFIISIVVAVILIICAFSIGGRPQKPFVKGLITSVKCDTSLRTINNRVETKYNCILKLTYSVNNIEYLGEIMIESNTIYNPNTYIDIEYDEFNPNIINIKGLDNSTQSYISLGIAVAIIIFSWFNFYLTSKSKTYATIQGASFLGNMFSPTSSSLRVNY
jgi:hypothetical protein